MKTPWIVVAVVMIIVTAGCEREVRRLKTPAPSSAPAQASQSADLHAGGASGARSPKNLYEENAYAMSQGKRLFSWYNCVGCHANGGGGSGPALMDDKWIYGAEAANVYTTIVDGRPNGMPSFRNRITDAQVWQIVAYVESMSGQAPLPALPGRSDHLSAGTPESGRPAQTPVKTGTP